MLNIPGYWENPGLHLIKIGRRDFWLVMYLAVKAAGDLALAGLPRVVIDSLRTPSSHF
jgi:hypothetical protein